MLPKEPVAPSAPPAFGTQPPATPPLPFIDDPAAMAPPGI
ncbi:hypothetical protein ACP_1999 [Acidobacterium capsulatum ATCC 51196]|uniref:Uncharacterized protein n=1 Tax=Acidobacterium capsulatum (strain ATCC 51196 / DSM 11244 / BCRC 80197 / JCM 7670 / NBRC 15755 / NCIMB 13165 / 161) TaxID=240015 RepID=C1F8U1_ACIC5|nr:hypothetical protein ACP_1999 [Acidobacterium capsulatum ATCC 51196]